MPTRRTLLLTGVAAATFAAGGTIAASARPDEMAPRYGTAGLSQDLTPVQQEAIAAVQSDAPIPVQDAQGRARGFVRDSALTARDDRVTVKVLAGFREAQGPADQEYLGLFESLRVLDPVPVVDANGVTVGYWTHDFKEIDELARLTPKAQATVDRLLR